MGYDICITRNKDYDSDKQEEIPLSEWLAVVDSDPELERRENIEMTLPDGQILRMQSKSPPVIWKNNAEGEVWFDYRRGEIAVKNPDTMIFKKMHDLALKLGAVLQGEEGELYDEKGEIINAETTANDKNKKTWWSRFF